MSFGVKLRSSVFRKGKQAFGDDNPEIGWKEAGGKFPSVDSFEACFSTSKAV